MTQAYVNFVYKNKLNDKQTSAKYSDIVDFKL